MNRAFANLPSFCVVLLLAGGILSCDKKADLNNDQDPTAFRPSVTRPFTLTDPQPIDWEVADPDSISPPTSATLDIDKLPAEPFSINEFKPLASPMKEYDLDVDQLEVTPLQFDTIPFTFKMSIIPQPVVKEIEMPSIAENTTTGLLQLSTVEGIPSVEIKVILENDDGTFWIATFNDGLCLYTGEKIFIYDYSRIYDVIKDKDGLLWVSTADGIYILDFQKNIQSHFLSGKAVSELYCDQENIMWIHHFNNGTFTMNAERTQLLKINEEFDRIIRIWEDQEQNIWIGHADRISIIGKDRKGYLKIEDTQDYRIGLISTFFADQEGNVWVDSRKDRQLWDVPNSTERGLLSFSLKDKTVRTLDRENGFTGYAIKYQEDGLGRLWIFQNDTAFILDANRTAYKSITTNGSLNTLFRLGYTMKDSRGNIWIGTHNKGAIIIDPDGPLSEHLDESDGLMNSEIGNIEEDSRGDIWLATAAGGINIYDPKKGVIRRLDYTKLKNGNFLKLQFSEEIEQDKYFVEGRNRFSIIDRSINNIKHYNTGRLQGGRIRDLLIDESNNFWLPNSRGLMVFNIELNQVKWISEKSAQFPGRDTQEIIDDESGRYWIATDVGLMIINPTENTIQYLTEKEGLCNNEVTRILPREDGELWIATTDGLSIINTKEQTITNIGEEQGLVPDELYEIQEKEGIIYLGSVNGLIQMKPIPGKNNGWNFYNFNAAQGFPANNYLRGGGHVMENGQLWMGAGNPSLKLNILTQDPAIDTMPCPVAIIGLKISDQNVTFESKADLNSFFETQDTLWYEGGKQFYLEQTFPQDSGYVFENNIHWDSLSLPFKMPIGLKLPHDQNSLQFSYANLCVFNRDKISCRYILEGKDDDWVYGNDASTSKTYFNLLSGRYTFKVETKGITGTWGAPAEFSFSILPPWWKTWWAYTSYLILTVLILYALVRWRTRALLRRSHELENIVSERTEELRLAKLAAEAANEAKSTFLSTVSHELRTPLTSIIGFTKLNQKNLAEKLFPKLDPADAKAQKIAQRVTKNLDIVSSEGERLTHLINELLDLAKIESGKVDWKMEQLNPAELIERAVNATAALFAQKPSLKLITDIQEDLPPFSGDKDRLLQVLINLISNSVKFTESGTVTVGAYCNTPLQALTFSVSDTGSGIPVDQHDKVFERFQQVEDNQAGKPKGTGLGLPICKEIVAYHGGRIWVESEMGKGSTFFVSLPLPLPEKSV